MWGSVMFGNCLLIVASRETSCWRRTRAKGLSPNSRFCACTSGFKTLCEAREAVSIQSCDTAFQSQTFSIKALASNPTLQTQPHQKTGWQPVGPESVCGYMRRYVRGARKTDVCRYTYDIYIYIYTYIIYIYIYSSSTCAGTTSSESRSFPMNSKALVV